MWLRQHVDPIKDILFLLYFLRTVIVVHFHCITVLTNYLENYVSKSINRNQLLNSVLCKKVKTTQVIFKVLMHGRRQELKFVREKTFYILRDITHIKNLFTTFKVHNIQCNFTCFEKFYKVL